MTIKQTLTNFSSCKKPNKLQPCLLTVKPPFKHAHGQLKRFKIDILFKIQFATNN